jgi:hypothetical protein
MDLKLPQHLSHPSSEQQFDPGEDMDHSPYSTDPSSPLPWRSRRCWKRLGWISPLPDQRRRGASANARSSSSIYSRPGNHLPRRDLERGRRLGYRSSERGGPAGGGDAAKRAELNWRGCDGRQNIRTGESAEFRASRHR